MSQPKINTQKSIYQTCLSDKSQRWPGDVLCCKAHSLLKQGKKLFFLRWWDGKRFNNFATRKRREWVFRVKSLKHDDWVGGEMHIADNNHPSNWFYGYDYIPLTKNIEIRLSKGGPIGSRYFMYSFNPFV